jgi:hypothetical protein
MPGESSGTRESGVRDLRDPGNESVFFWSEVAWVRLQKILFLKIPGAGEFFGELDGR